MGGEQKTRSPLGFSMAGRATRPILFCLLKDRFCVYDRHRVTRLASVGNPDDSSTIVICFFGDENNVTYRALRPFLPGVDDFYMHRDFMTRGNFRLGILRLLCLSVSLVTLVSIHVAAHFVCLSV